MSIYLCLQCEKYGYEFDGKINMWDLRYYATRVEERQYAVDQNVLKNYFPLEKVTAGLLSIYQVTMQMSGLVVISILNSCLLHLIVLLYETSS